MNRKTIIILKLYSLVLFVLFTACKVDKPIIHVIKESDNTIYIDNDDTNSVIIQKAYYGNYNFMLCGNDRIFLHKEMPHVEICIPSEVDYSRPYYLINLRPEKIIEIEASKIDSFINGLLVVYPTEGIGTISIASNTDTIRNKAYTAITSAISAKNKIKPCIRTATRRFTEQESIVLDYKLKNKPYNADSIKWEVGFANEITDVDIIN